MVRRFRQRRGVLLLVVLSLLVVFLLIAVTFVVVANQQRQAAKAASRMNQAGTDPRDLADGALMQLLRDLRPVAAPRSRVFGHSLLEDVYGRAELFKGQVIASPPNATSGQFVDLVTAWTSLKDINGNDYAPPKLSANYYNGCVLTILSGRARGSSGRIVAYEPFFDTSVPANPKARLRVMFFSDENHIQVQSPDDSRNARFLVNGRPFSGSGIGYNPSTRSLDIQNSEGRQYALMPNWTGYVLTANLSTLASLEGGANESYDVPDFQNIFLALEVPDAADPNRLAGVIPSFHRPALINYWLEREDTLTLDNLFDQNGPPGPQATEYRDLVRRILFRPNSGDHPFFPKLEDVDQANPGDVDRDGNMLRDAAIHGPWDVDNNGDGETDSVWIDLGFPVAQTSDGRTYKPLFAILGTDLDGRFNINAHGNIQQVASGVTGIPDPTAVFLAGGQISSDLPPGEGYGPAEINMGPGYGDLFPTQEDARFRFSQRRINYSAASRLVPGCYGTVLGFNPTLNRPGIIGLDQRAALKFFEYPSSNSDLNAFGFPLTSFSTPADMSGRYALGLNDRGVPYFEGLTDPFRIVDDSPYELNLARSAVRGESSTPITNDTPDAPFTAAELERVLRAYDADAVSLPSRLPDLWPAVFQSSNTTFSANRRLITSDSFDLPVPNATATEEFRAAGLHYVRSISDMLWARLQAEGLDEWEINGEPFDDINGNGICDFSAGEWNGAMHDRNGNGRYDPGELHKLLSWDLQMGLRMDVNRPLGNGRDDATFSPSNGVVDEPSESGHPYTDQNNDDQFNFPGEFLNRDLTNGTDVNNDGSFDVRDNMLARQLYARHLYVLMMLLSHAPGSPGDPPYVHPVDSNDPANTNVNLKRRLTARRIAQWAINAVDFRDADAIMTPFEYDENPFDGWIVDGDPATDESNDGVDNDGNGLTDSADPNEQGRQLVWGCEYPHLVLTETLAFHDRRVTDTSAGGTREQGDPDLDSARIAKGSAYVELFCAGNEHNLLFPAELYSGNQLDLARTAPGSFSPVWRLAVSSSRLDRPENDLLSRLGPDYPANDNEGPTSETSTQLDPSNFYVDGDAPSAGAAAGDIEIERIVWFSTQAPQPTYPHRNRVYYNRGASTQLPPGHYAVVGPRAMNWIGWDKGTLEETDHRIQIQSSAVNVYNNNGSPNPPTPPPMRQPVGIVAAADPPPGWTNSQKTAPHGIGFSISEPLRNNYYPEPGIQTVGAQEQAWWDTYTAPIDAPLDEQMSVLPPEVLKTGTTEEFKTVFLQRLANPLLPWNPLPDRNGYDPSRPVNPYITIDWMPIDLTVFNGEDNGKPANWDMGEFDQLDPDPPGPVSFATRERGVPQTVGGDTDLWSTLTEDPQLTSRVDPNNYVFRYRLAHTLGYLNSNFGPANLSSPNPGDPQRPFPWLTWNDRPFVSQFELMLVPASAPGRLLHEYTMARSHDPLASEDKPFDPQPADRYASFRAPFGHLLNFFQTSNNPPPNHAAKFYRILEYTHVPSRFVGTETMLNQGVFDAGGPGTAKFHTPFNRLSNYREPGRVNVNTITSGRVWNGILAGHPGPNWNVLIDSRRGYLPTAGILAFDNRFPTLFANPLRSPDAGNLVPLPNLRRPGVECTLLRSNEAPSNRQPLFAAPDASPFKQEFNHRDRNPYFRYQPMQRLANLLTTRSNVYAVWITVGYFEAQSVEKHPRFNDFKNTGEIQYVFPDGYMLGPELGSDQGDVTRHRAFYIIDRSIPVAYEPGKNHNVENTILLRRFIE